MTRLISYRNPFSPLWSERNDTDAWLRDFARSASERAEQWAPACDVKETEDHYYLDFDLPGINLEDLHIETKDNQLFVTGERKEERHEKKGASHFSERTYGKFSRVFTLPTSVDSDKIEATYHHGVLHVAVPKSAASKPRRISVSTGPSSDLENKSIRAA